MATNKRMFSNDIVGSDAFLEMPTSTQALYFHLNMKADDEGFVNPKMIMRMVGCGEDDLRILIGKKFVVPFSNGVVVVKHWLINNNKIQKDRFKPTLYTEQKKTLLIKENRSYTLNEKTGKSLLLTECYQDVNGSLPQNRREENRIEENRIDNTSSDVVPKSKKFIKPTLDEIKTYCSERSNSINPQKFIDFYESKGWLIGKNSMKDWKAAVRTWEGNGFGNQKSSSAVLHTDQGSDIVRAMELKAKQNK